MHNFNHLYYFYIVAKLKSVTAAAQFLNTSQPSLSTQIKTLEINLKRQLFFKQGRFLELTSEGQRIYSFCSKMFDAYEDLNNYLHTQEGSEEIKIGFSNEISRPFIANIVSEVLKKYRADVRPSVKLVSVPHDVLIDRLKTKKIDFILTNTQVLDFELKTIKDFTFPIVLAGTINFIREQGLKDLKKPDMILKKAAKYLALPSEHLKLRLETNAFLLYKKINSNCLIESDNLTTIISTTLEGITFCLLPEPYIYKELKTHNLKALLPPGALWSHQLYLITRNDMGKNTFIKRLSLEIERLKQQH